MNDVRPFLLPLSYLYGGVAALRNYLYDRGFLKTYGVPVPVVSVGNLSAGGTGKTSLVRFLAGELSKKAHLCILLRGYKRSTKGALIVSEGKGPLVGHLEAGDEAFMLAKLLKRVSVVVSEDRYEGALRAVRDLKAELILLDDGFQHRRLKRNLDIVLLRKRDLSDRLLPAGLLREPLGSLKRADAIVLSYQDLEPFSFSFGDKKIFKMFRKDWHFKDQTFAEIPLEELKGKEVIAFAGLGSNEQFFATLKRLGFILKDTLSFPDHYHYRDFKPKKGEIYITTLKDMVKLPPCDNVFALDFHLEVEGLKEFVLSATGMSAQTISN